MKINKNQLFIAFFILTLLIGFFFRFFKLGQTPSGLYLDEASIGYNALSILKTGKDEYGQTFPALFRSVGDFKTPTYIYLTSPLVALFGLSPFSVRLLSALFGLFTLPVLYLLLRKIIKSKHSQVVALVSMFFLSVSPWHIILSRTAYESTVALLFLLLGIFLFIKSLEKSWIYPLSATFFGLSFISYHAERLLAPVVVLSLLVYYWKDVFHNLSKKIPVLIISIIIGILIVGPTLLLMRSPGFLKRAGTLNIFSFSNQLPYGHSDKLSGLSNNNYLLSIKEFSSLYVSYFSPRYLFSLGDSSPRSSFPGLGSFFVWQFPLFLLGLYTLYKDKENSNLKHFILTLLLVSPIPASLTRDPYSTIRALPMIVPLVTIMALGAIRFYELTLRYSRKIFLAFTLVIIFFSLSKLFVSVFYLNDYFNYSSWNYGWKDTIEKLPSLNQDLPVVIDNSRGIPYPIILFYLKFDPQTYQKTNFEVTTQEYYNNLSINPVKNLGKITIRKIDWGKDSDHIEQYLIGDTITISDLELHNHRLDKISDILNPDGSIAIRIVKTNPLKQ
jgi:4-amino-4-deoxy-L-arabinose transferase-like glycosyltransferase